MIFKRRFQLTWVSGITIITLYPLAFSYPSQ
ncbi:hypothetical protein SAI_0361, partial [Streptococcus agalactiae H36B]